MTPTRTMHDIYREAPPKSPARFASSLIPFQSGSHLPSRKLAYPILAKGKSSTQKCRLGWDMLGPRRVTLLIDKILHHQVPRMMIIPLFIGF